MTEHSILEPLGVFVLGLMIGSFCNVLIYRLPARESIVAPGSHCRACAMPIAPWDNIPLVSYLLLAGRCRRCGAPISPRYPCVEFASGALYVLLWFKYGVTPTLLVYAVLSSSLLAVALIDLEHAIIPNRITYPGMFLGLVFSMWAGPISPLWGSTFLASLVGLLVGGLFFYLVALISKGGMGGGDIKLIAMIGAFVGWQGTLFTIFVGAFIGSLVGITLMLLGQKGRKDKIPFGPYLALGALLFSFVGDELIAWYVGWTF